MTTSDTGRPAGSSNLLWVIVWVGLGLALGLCLATQGRNVAAEYYAAYFLEESLSSVLVIGIVLLTTIGASVLIGNMGAQQ
jgi:K+ transporter